MDILITLHRLSPCPHSQVPCQQRHCHRPLYYSQVITIKVQPPSNYPLSLHELASFVDNKGLSQVWIWYGSVLHDKESRRPVTLNPHETKSPSPSLGYHTKSLLLTYERERDGYISESKKYKYERGKRKKIILFFKYFVIL